MARQPAREGVAAAGAEAERATAWHAHLAGDSASPASFCPRETQLSPQPPLKPNRRITPDD
eukprot:scaffold3273_cov363-Prasinococcus_capsulatus_cf.AAC.6